jgi:hypothetical protein
VPRAPLLCSLVSHWCYVLFKQGIYTYLMLARFALYCTSCCTMRQVGWHGCCIHV